MSDTELITKLRHISENPDSISFEKLEYVSCLLKCTMIDMFWCGKITNETLRSVLLGGESE